MNLKCKACKRAHTPKCKQCHALHKGIRKPTAPPGRAHEHKGYVRNAKHKGQERCHETC